MTTHNPWDDLCARAGCGHEMRAHILDWDLGVDIDCRVEGCTCPDYRPPRSGRNRSGAAHSAVDPHGHVSAGDR